MSNTRKITDDMPLREALNVLCRDMPEGWSITLELDNSGSDLRLYDDEGDQIEFPSNHGTLVDEIDDALEYALDCHINRVKGDLCDDQN